MVYLNKADQFNFQSLNLNDGGVDKDTDQVVNNIHQERPTNEENELCPYWH